MGRYKALEPVKDAETGRVTMRVPKLRLQALLHAEIQKLRDDGIEPDLDEIVWLYELCKEEIFPRADEPPCFAVPPIVFTLKGNTDVVLWEPTIEALVWLDEQASQWWQDGNDLPPTIFAYANSGPEPIVPFPALYEPRKARKIVNDWFRRLRLPQSLLVWAYNRLTGVHDEGYVEVELPQNCMVRNDAATPMEWGEVIAKLSAIYQQPPEVFVRMNVSQVVSLWENGDSTQIASLLGVEQGKPARGGGARALLALNAAVRQIRANHEVKA